MVPQKLRFKLLVNSAHTVPDLDCFAKVERTCNHMNAAISNYREAQFKSSEPEYSRGHLVRDFLLENSAPEAHAERLQTRAGRYRGFNLLLGDRNAIHYVSNRTQRPGYKLNIN